MARLLYMKRREIWSKPNPEPIVHRVSREEYNTTETIVTSSPKEHKCRK